MTVAREEPAMTLTAFRIGAAAWIFTGVLHDTLELVLDRDPGVEAAMREASSIDIGPLSLQPALLTSGVSLAMGMAMVVVGILLWMIGDALRGAPDRLARFVAVALAGSVIVLVLAALHLLGPPLITFTVASIAFAAALARAKRSARATQSPSVRVGGPGAR